MITDFALDPHVLVILFLCKIPNRAIAQFPRACATVESLQSHSCCPLLNGSGSPCGEAEGRGKCSEITVDNSPHGPPYDLVGIDDRERWPERFFNRSCLCNENFGGFDCSRCRPGWEGEDCSRKRSLNIRKNILNLEEEEKIRFLEILDQSKKTMHPDYVIAREHYRNLMGENGTETPDFVNVSIYDLFVWNHYYSVRDTLLGPGQAYTDIDFSHEGPAFLTWHRMHLLNLEADLQKLSGNSSLSIPYWDFATGGSSCDICTNDLFGERNPSEQTLLSPNSIFSEWNVICLSLNWFDDNIKLCNGTGEGPIRRNPGGNTDRPAVQTLPTLDDVTSCLQVKDYDTPPFFSNSDESFRNALEGYANPNGHFDEGVRTLHNLAHLFLNGTGGITHASANDPIFVLLHAYTDAIFDEWMLRFNSTIFDYPTENAPIGHNLDSNMVPFFPPVTNREMFVPAEVLGYGYAIQLPEPEFVEANDGPSFLWAIFSVSCFVVLAAFLLVLMSFVQRFRRRKREENLYQSLIADEVSTGIHYTA